jgi:hypothetical protein
MRCFVLGFCLVVTALPALAQEPLGLAAPQAVTQSGLLKHILPRFSLKTGIRVTPDPTGTMVLANAPPGVAVFEGGGITYYLQVNDGPDQMRFLDWITSDIGKRTIDSFQLDGAQPFSASIQSTIRDDQPVFDGDAAKGAGLSLEHCGRCHVIGPQNRMKGLGSTPSFAVLRALPDWDIRFQQFYALRPHAAFTQIDGVTAPFDPQYPPPIAPVRITLTDLTAILAFVAAISAADLGAPLHLQ